MITANMLLAKPAHQTPMTEATYYGKNDKLIKIEKILESILSKSTKDLSYVSTDEFISKMDSIADILAEIFGLRSCSINKSLYSMVNPIGGLVLATTSGATVNAVVYKYARYAVGANKTEIVSIDKNHKTVRFKPGKDYTVSMFVGANNFANYDELTLTAREILAMMLHEIGHTFFVGPISELTPYAAMMLTPSGMVGLINTAIAGAVIEIDSLKLPIQDPIAKIINTLSQYMTPGSHIGKIIHTVSMLISLISRAVKGIGMNIPNTLARLLTGVLGYNAEKYSDSFATAYGYGEELYTFLSKISRNRIYNSNHNISTPQNVQDLADVFTAILKLSNTILGIIGGVHPNSEGRLMNNIKYMEAAGDKITDPILKKEYMAQLKSMKALRHDIANIKDPRVGEILPKILVNLQDALNISDVKDLLSAVRPGNNYINLDTTID